MKKVFIISIALLSLFLFSCSTGFGSEADLQDELEGLSDEELDFVIQEAKIHEGKALVGNAIESDILIKKYDTDLVIRSAYDMKYDRESDESCTELENCIKHTVADLLKDGWLTNDFINSKNGRDQTCEEECSSRGMECIGAFRGSAGTTSGEYNYDNARMWGPVDCVDPVGGQRNGEDTVQWCMCI